MTISVELDIEPVECFDIISEYADALYEQFNISSASIDPKPSQPVTLDNFDSREVLNQANYTSSVDDEELFYANNLTEFNKPSPSVKPVNSHAVTPQNLNLEQIVDAVENPVCPSLSYKPSVISSEKPEKVKITGSFKTPKQNYIDFKDNHDTRTSKIEDINQVYALFENNDFPKIFNRVSKCLKLENGSIRTVTFTNPLKNEKDVSPSFTPWKKELRIPAIKPKKIVFDKLSQNQYNKMVNNAFLPHEMGHAKVEEQNPHVCTGSSKLKGFDEHLADAIVLDSLKGTPQFFRTKQERIRFENIWVTPKNDNPIPEAEKNYCNSLIAKENLSFIPGKQATINLLGKESLKQKYDLALKNVLDARYGDDNYKETVYGEIRNLSNNYQKQAIKIINLSNKDYQFSKKRIENVWYDVEKSTIRFMEEI